MHICFVCSEYPPAPCGGIGSFTQTLARALVRRGHRVTAIGAYPDEHAYASPPDEGVQIIRISRKGPPVLRVLLNRRKLIRAIAELNALHPIDILDGGEMDISTVNPSTPGIKVLRMHGGPSFFQTGVRSQVWKEIWAFRYVADELCAVSHCVGEGTRQALGLGNRHIEVIHNPIDTRLFAPSAADHAEEDGLIVFTGTIIERKGIRQLIQAMPRIVAAVPNARLEIYGGEAIDPPPKTSFQETLQRMLPPEIASHVSWKGRVARAMLPQALQHASVCVYPSHIEAMPIGWLEGMAAGKAVVASQTGPGPEIIDDGETGLLCNPHDPASIANALIRVLKDANLRRRLGVNARRAAEQRFDLETIVSRNEEYYKKLITNRR